MQQHHLHYIHQSMAGSIDEDDAHLKRSKRRGNYNCGRCGQPKKGHSCNISSSSSGGGGGNISTTINTTTSNGNGNGNGNANANATPCTDSSSIIAPSPTFHTPPNLPPRQPSMNLRRALSFDEEPVAIISDDEEEEEEEADLEDPVEMMLDSQNGLPINCLWEVMKRLPPPDLLSAAKVCKGWSDCSRRIWKAAEELRLKVPPRAQVWFVGSVLKKCSGLVNLSLRMESDVDATMLACIAFSCPNLQSMDIRVSEKAINRITGDELGRFVAEKRCLSSLKVEGCSSLGSFTLSSSSLSTIWLSDLYRLSKMVFNCPNLKEISLDFSRQENDSTDLAAMVDCLGRTCQKLENIHIASIRLSHYVVLALTAANLRSLRMLSLVLGSEITDASVAAIASSYPDLKLLDLSGSSISDSGIGMICNELTETLSRLLLALCPNITSSGIQFAVAQLPYLELMDCGMTLCDPNSEDANEEKEPGSDNNDPKPNHPRKSPKRKLHLLYQKMIIKHARLKKLSLWGCSGLDSLYLNCPLLNDLNLNSCTNLHPERLLLQCPSLESVHASGCNQTLVGAIQSQVCKDFAALDDYFPCKRMADSSKRVRVPHFLSPQGPDNLKKRKISRPECTVHIQ